jgi:hypothetical protein
LPGCTTTAMSKASERGGYRQRSEQSQKLKG